MEKFLVVYEDIWNNKYTYQTNKIGETIKEIIVQFELPIQEHVDYEKLDSDNPYDAGTFGKGFYDIEFLDDGEYIGKIMIFELENSSPVVGIEAMTLIEPNVLLKLEEKGAHYRCENCGNNMFSQYEWKGNSNIYSCNGCNTMYKKKEK